MANVISLGYQGLAVLKIQEYLNALHGYYPDIPLISEQGIYDKNTKLAITRFQSLTGLCPSGVVDTLTWDKLILKYQSMDDIIDENMYANIRIEKGQCGVEVCKMQDYLNQITPEGGLIKVDGIFGIATQAKVIQFQIRYGLKATGVINAHTWNVIINHI